MRRWFNRFSEWALAEGSDAFGSFIRVAVIVTVMFVAAMLLVTAVIAIITGITITVIGDQQPSLFCAEGTTVHTEPATQIVGKIPVQGVRYTCS